MRLKRVTVEIVLVAKDESEARVKTERLLTPLRRRVKLASIRHVTDEPEGK